MHTYVIPVYLIGLAHRIIQTNIPISRGGELICRWAQTWDLAAHLSQPGI